MSKKISELTACVVDHGLFLPVALRLADDYARVFYYTPTERVLPVIEEGIVGDGFARLTRIYDPWRVKDKCDLFVFPDVGFTGMQQELRRQKIPVWGHNGADILEYDKGKFLRTLEKVGLEVPPHTIITGLSALRSHLRDKSDKWVKISKWRGNMETMHWRDFEQDDVTMDQLACALGPCKEELDFFVFDKIEADVEDGIDTWCIDGKYPQTVFHGIECKDKSYLCSAQPFSSINEEVRSANEAFAPVLAQYGYRGFFTTEVRIAEDKSYFIDPTCRAGSPPSQLMTEMIENLGEVIYGGALGECVEPIVSEPYGVQALVTGDREPKEWLSLSIPPSLKPHLKLGFAGQIGDNTVIPPHPLENMLGWVVATGNTVKGAIETLKERAAMLPCGLKCDVTSIAHLLDEAKEAKKEGINVAGKIPEPEVVL